MWVTVTAILVGALGTVPKGLEKKTEGIGNPMKNQDHSDYSMVKANQNTQKSPGDQRRLAVKGTSGKNYKLTLVSAREMC